MRQEALSLEGLFFKISTYLFLKIFKRCVCAHRCASACRSKEALDPGGWITGGCELPVQMLGTEL